MNENTITKLKTAFDAIQQTISGTDVENHFRGITKMVKMGSNA